MKISRKMFFAVVLFLPCMYLILNSVPALCQSMNQQDDGSTRDGLPQLPQYETVQEAMNAADTFPVGSVGEYNALVCCYRLLEESPSAQAEDFAKLWKRSPEILRSRMGFKWDKYSATEINSATTGEDVVLAYLRSRYDNFSEASSGKRLADITKKKLKECPLKPKP